MVRSEKQFRSTEKEIDSRLHADKTDDEMKQSSGTENSNNLESGTLTVTLASEQRSFSEEDKSFWDIFNGTYAQH